MVIVMKFMISSLLYKMKCFSKTYRFSFSVGTLLTLWTGWNMPRVARFKKNGMMQKAIGSKFSNFWMRKKCMSVCNEFKLVAWLPARFLLLSRGLDLICSSIITLTG